MSRSQSSHNVDQVLHYMNECVDARANMPKILADNRFLKLLFHMAEEASSSLLPHLRRLTDACIAAQKRLADAESKKRRIKNENIKVAKKAKLLHGPELLATSSLKAKLQGLGKAPGALAKSANSSAHLEEEVLSDDETLEDAPTRDPQAASRQSDRSSILQSEDSTTSSEVTEKSQVERDANNVAHEEQSVMSVSAVDRAVSPSESHFGLVLTTGSTSNRQASPSESYRSSISQAEELTTSSRMAEKGQVEQDENDLVHEEQSGVRRYAVDRAVSPSKFHLGPVYATGSTSTRQATPTKSHRESAILQSKDLTIPLETAEKRRMEQDNNNLHYEEQGSMTEPAVDRAVPPPESQFGPAPTTESTATSPSKYEIEIAITRGSPASILNPIKRFCLTKLQHNNLENREICCDDLFRVCHVLDFNFVKSRLLSISEAGASNNAGSIPMQETWKLSDADQIVAAIQMIKGTTNHSLISKAYSQMRLYETVQKKSQLVAVSELKQTRKKSSTLAIQGMARDQTGDQPGAKTVRAKKDYETAYKAGKNWIDVAEWFGGDGIVVVFVLAGILSGKVEDTWRTFQRNCMKHISTLLHSIRALVGALGQGALEHYCREGRLSDECVRKVRDVEGYLTAESESDEDVAGADD